jgi:AraC-like DNA-binding protein
LRGASVPRRQARRGIDAARSTVPVMHADPARDWTVDDLGREVAVSGSVLAQRFTDLVGEAPMRYLANWRMQLANR